MNKKKTDRPIIHNVPDYSDSVAEEALRNVGDQGYADMNSAMERKTNPQAEDLYEEIPFSDERRGDKAAHDSDQDPDPEDIPQQYS